MIVAWTTVFTGNSQTTYLSEGFEGGATPAGWDEEYVSGSEPWRYRNGGHSPNDNNWLVPPEQIDITRNPPGAYAGTYNAIFFKQGDNNERTKLITPEMDLEGGTSVELSFYLCQIPWTFGGSTSWDVLRVYYKTAEGNPWVLLQEYLDPVYEWELQTLVLPNLSSTYYVAFEGHTRWGYGTCIDNVVIEEKGLQHLWIGDIKFQQAFADFIPSGTPDVPVLRVDFKVYGNTDSAMLERMTFSSMNTSDADILPNGVKLYSTESQFFSMDHPLGSPTDFVAGVANFTGLSHSLPRGHSYVWLVYDLDADATHGNILDVMVASGGILANDTLYPSTGQSPEGEIVIYETLYSQDFEGSHGWDLTGEFEVNSPSGLGGIPGNPDPAAAYSGTKVLGTDLTGLGTFPYQYEPGLSNAASYRATSPTINVKYYKSLNLFYKRYFNIEVWDEATLQVSTDNGTTWHNFWENSTYMTDFQWVQEQLPIPDEYARTEQLKLRYQLGPTDGLNNYSGWNIDDVYLTGEFISKDVGVSQWIHPLSGSGHTANDSVTVRIENYGGADITVPVPVAYSFDGGENWTVNIMNQDIPIGGSVVFTFPSRVDLTVPGYRPSVLARTALPGDQYAGNNKVATDIFIVPTYAPPHAEDFETNDGYWRASGSPVWEYGTPNGAVINSASSGSKSWATGLTQEYGDLLSQPYLTIFEDGFETDKGWTFGGEFERAIPSNMYPPYFAFDSLYCLGTDLTGQGTNPYYYENGITSGTAYTATSPDFDVSSYSNVTVGFASWIMIQDGDSLRLEASPDGGSHWYTLWKNTEGGIMESDFEFIQHSVPDSLTYTSTLRFRFSLFHTSAGGPVAEGWFIDNFKLQGDLVDDTGGHLSSPSFDLTGVADPLFEARLWVETEEGVDGASLFYSLDDGENWTAITNSSVYSEYWNWYTGDPVSALGTDGWSGQSGGWMTVRHLLPPAVVNQDNVQLRFTFMADKVDNQHDGLALDDARIMEAPMDAGILDLLEPVSSCELGQDQPLTIRLQNFGPRDLQPGDSILVGFHIDRAGEIQEGQEYIYLSQVLPVSATRDITLSTTFDFSQSGTYLTDVYTIEEDPHFYQALSNDTVSRSILVQKPAVDLGPDISTPRPDTVVLRAYSEVGGQTYLWQDSSTDSVFHVSTEGTYWVRVTNGLGCVASDTIQVSQLIIDVGVSQFLSPLSACELGSQESVQVSIRNLGTDTIAAGDTIIVRGEVNQSPAFLDTLHLSQPFRPGESIDMIFSDQFDFSAPGSYQMKLYTAYGKDVNDQNDTLDHTLEVWGYPDVDLGPDTVVVAGSYLLAPVPGYAAYLWQDASTLETFTVDEPGLGLYHVTVTDIHQCTEQDSVIVTLNVPDVALDQILSPASSCELSSSITVAARIRNTGNQIIASGQTMNVAYRINGGSPVQDILTLSASFLPGHTIDFTFSQSESVQTGEWYEFEVFVDYPADVKAYNDTMAREVGVFEAPVVDLGDDYQVVNDFQHLLDAGPGFVSYEWQDGSTDQTFLVTQPGVHTYGVTVTDVNGCVVYEEVQVMLAMPDVGVMEVSWPTTSCSSGNAEHIQLAIKNFGNWDIEASANFIVAYSLNGELAVVEDVVLDSTFESGSVMYHTFATTEDFSMQQRYEVMAFIEYGSDLNPTNDIILVNVDVLGEPLVDIGNGQDTMLVYDPVTLSATPGYASYLWQDGSTDSIYQISSPGTGLYHVLVTDENDCSTRDSVYVIYDVPDLGITRIVSPVSDCELGPVTPVTMEIINNGHYRISTGDTLIITYTVDGGLPVTDTVNLVSDLPPGQTHMLTFATGYDFSGLGSYQLTVDLYFAPDENLSDNTLNSTVHVWGYPVADISGGADTLHVVLPYTLDADVGYSAYLWQDNSTGQWFDVTQNGLHWVRVTDANGCSDRDSVYMLTNVGTGGIQAGGGKISIFPNPASDILNVSVDMDSPGEVILEIYTVLNKLVHQEKLMPEKSARTEVDVSGLASGSYIVRITVDQVPYTTMVVVE
jgi:hypothetical protein